MSHGIADFALALPAGPTSIVSGRRLRTFPDGCLGPAGVHEQVWSGIAQGHTSILGHPPPVTRIGYIATFPQSRSIFRVALLFHDLDLTELGRLLGSRLAVFRILCSQTIEHIHPVLRDRFG